jgi:tRNA(Arg) A34 adenosine deaminase TadA
MTCHPNLALREKTLLFVSAEGCAACLLALVQIGIGSRNRNHRLTK